MKVKDITAIVTGGGSGMGAATARALAAAGAKVALWDLNIEAADNVAREIKGLAVACDVISEESVISALKTTKEKLGSPRVLVNCAGILIGQKLVGKEGPGDFDHFSKMIHVNLIGTYNTMRLTAAEMAKLEPVDNEGSRGVIINAASIAAFEGQRGQVGYSASKAGVVGMTLPAARDLAYYGIRVMAIAPGAVDTPMIGGVRDDIRQKLEAAIPFPSRFAKPEEFAKLALQIVDNDMLNGTTIRLDGAARLSA